MKKLLPILAIAVGGFATFVFNPGSKAVAAPAEEILATVKYNIKIKNNTGEAISTIATSGGGYTLSNGVTTTIKMEKGAAFF